MEAWELDVLERAAQCLARARYVIALTGAGLSVESGIPPFRGPGGLWTKHGEPPMDGYQRMLADPAKHWREMLARRTGDDEFVRAIRDARPNPGHHALARLEAIGALKHTISQKHRQPPLRSGERQRDGDPWKPHEAALHRVRGALAVRRIPRDARSRWTRVAR